MEKKQLPPDFRDFFEILNRRGVRYMVAGGWALALHGWPRATRDIDIWVAIDPANGYPRRTATLWDGVEISFLGYEDFVRNKRASGRLKDLADLESLGEDPHA